MAAKLKIIPTGYVEIDAKNLIYDPVKRTIYVKWAFKTSGKTEITNPVEYYEVRFEYADTKGNWYTYYTYNQRITGESYTDLGKTPPITFTTPESVPLPYNAVRIRVRIKAYPRYFQDSKQAYGTNPTAQYPAFNNGDKFIDSPVLELTLSDLPADPSAPEVELDENSLLKMSYQTTDSLAYAVEFEVINAETLEALFIQKTPLSSIVSDFYDRKKQYLPDPDKELTKAHYDQKNNVFYKIVDDSRIDIIPEAGKVYVDIDTNVAYEWNGTKYIKLNYIPSNTASIDGKTYKNIKPIDSDDLDSHYEWAEIQQFSELSTYEPGNMVYLFDNVYNKKTRYVEDTIISVLNETDQRYYAYRCKVANTAPDYTTITGYQYNVGDYTYASKKFYKCISAYSNGDKASFTKYKDKWELLPDGIPFDERQWEKCVINTYNDDQSVKDTIPDITKVPVIVCTCSKKVTKPGKFNSANWVIINNVRDFNPNTEYLSVNSNGTDNASVVRRLPGEDYINPRYCLRTTIALGPSTEESNLSKADLENTKGVEGTYYLTSDNHVLQWFVGKDAKGNPNVLNYGEKAWFPVKGNTKVYYYAEDTKKYYIFGKKDIVLPNGKTKKIAAYVETDYNGNDRWIEQNIDIYWVNVPASTSLIRKGVSTFDMSSKSSMKVKVHCRLYGENGSITGFGDFTSDMQTIPTTKVDVDPDTGDEIGSVSDVKLSAYGYDQGNVQLKISWQPTTGAESYDIQYTTNPEFFESENLCTTTTVENSPYITPMLKGDAYYFRIRAVNSAGNGSWTTVKTPVVTGLIPSPPSTYESKTTASYDEELYLYWVYNPTDESTQREAEILINDTPISVSEFSERGIYGIGSPMIKNGVVYLAKIPLDGTDKEIVYNEQDWERTGGIRIKVSDYARGTNEIKWRVRTRGPLTGENYPNNGFSEYSITRTIKCYQSPQIESLRVLSGIDEVPETDGKRVINAYPFKIELQASPLAQTPISGNIEIVAGQSYTFLNTNGLYKNVNEGDVIYSENFNTNLFINNERWILTKEFMPNDAILKPNVSYKVRCKIDMDSGLSATWGYVEDDHVDVIFTFNPEDYAVGFNTTVEFDVPSLTATITPTAYGTYKDGNPIDNALLANELNIRVYRIDYNGELVRVDNGEIPSGSSVTDPYPSLAYMQYRIVGIHRVTGEIFFEDTPIKYVGSRFGGTLLSPTPIVIQWNDGISVNGLENPKILKLPYNIDISESNEKDVSTVKYIGRKRPVAYYGTQLGEKASWSTVILPDDRETLRQLRELAIYMGNVYVREPSGVGYWATVNVSWSSTHMELTMPVTIDITRVEV